MNITCSEQKVRNGFSVYFLYTLRDDGWKKNGKRNQRKH